MHCSRVSKEHDGVPLASIVKYTAHHGYERADCADAAVALNNVAAMNRIVQTGKRIDFSRDSIGLPTSHHTRASRPAPDDGTAGLPPARGENSNAGSEKPGGADRPGSPPFKLETQPRDPS